MKIRDRIIDFRRVKASELRPVVGYEGLYEVSSEGAVRRCGTGRGVVRGRMKRQTAHPMGYLALTLYRDNRAKSVLVHRLVAEAFHGSLDGGEVNHKDGNKRNNRADNLEIVTRQQNIDHAVAMGLIDNKGEKNSQARLTAEDVVTIRKLYTKGGYQNGGIGYKGLAKRFGVSWGTIRSIVQRRIWGHVA